MRLAIKKSALMIISIKKLVLISYAGINIKDHTAVATTNPKPTSMTFSKNEILNVCMSLNRTNNRLNKNPRNILTKNIIILTSILDIKVRLNENNGLITYNKNKHPIINPNKVLTNCSEKENKTL